MKQHNKTIVLLTVLFIAMFSISMFLYLSTPSIFLLLVMDYIVCFSYLFYKKVKLNRNTVITRL
ncbi:hypothetical protein HMPREF0833_10478 [Streptococcus parasanguinis ATCC 15912]|uniref:Uncharacterized protein n=1 Tax=Streptococcus parasanguinis (strain ATCC 15912 / DSM 6778 / CIP 104372 / LMG 14537) TaxID=760570 RepID=F8DGW3_STREP|nr:hypothetical protein HMPREF0833_10478 [Streptococcus parasanguinis ATCC 15912]